MAAIRPRIQRISEWHSIKAKHQLRTRVNVRVLRHEGFGALCVVGGARIPAMIRNIEISWDPKRQCSEEIPVGSTFDALVLGFDDDWRELVISKKAAEPSSFERFVAAHRIGEILSCEVIRLAPRSVVVSLDGGLEGTIPFTEIPDVQTRHREMTANWQLSIGDLVSAKLKSIGASNQEVLLSVCDALVELEKKDESLIVGSRERFDKLRGALHVRHALDGQGSAGVIGAAQRQLKILIIENEAAIVVPLEGALRDRAHIVTTASSGIQARQCIASLNEVDVILVDLQLGGYSGEQLLSDIGNKFPDARVIVFSGNEHAMHELQNTVYSLVLKPCEILNLIAIIEGASSVTHVERVLPLDEVISTIAGSERQSARDLHHATVKVIDGFLSSFSREFYKSVVAILRLSRRTGEVSCLRSINILPVFFDRWASSLQYSFVGDVLRGNELRSIAEEALRGGRDPLAQLVAELHVTQAIGFPVNSETLDDPMAIFVFVPAGSDYLDSALQRHLQQQSAALAVAIDRVCWDISVLRQQRALIAGSLMLGMTHELRNAVQAMMTQLFTMDQQLASAEKSCSADKLGICRQNLGDIKSRVKYLSKTFESLLGLSRRGRGDGQSLRDLLVEVVEQCWDTADQANVTLSLDCPESLECAAMIIPTSFFQCLMNLVLNGIQHTRAYRQKHGLVSIALGEETLNERRMAVIRVRDNAFGLDWLGHNRIFDLFYTTRRDGSGMGLYISQMITESLGGDLEVESSYKFRGTTFTVRLPVM